MRFAPVFLFGLAAAKTVSFKRQVAAINQVMSQINTEVGQLDSAIKGYQGGPGDNIVAASDKILATTKQALSTVQGLQPVTLQDAVQIQGVVQTLTDSLKQTVDDLISKKGALVAAGQGAKTESSLKMQVDGANALAKAISTKVPPEVQALAAQLGGGITSEIQRGLSAFAGSGGSGSGAGAGVGSSGPSPADGAGLSLGGSSADVGSTSTSGSASAGAGVGASGAAGASGASPATSASGAAGASAGMDAGASAGGSFPGLESMDDPSGIVDASSPRISSPAVYTGAGVPIKPASMFGLVAAAAIIFAM